MDSGSGLVGQRHTSPIDLFIGSRIRMARKVLHISQEKLADSIGVKFQQIQKYEKGRSRISASRLHQIAVTLQVPFSFFLPEAESPAEPGEGRGPVDLQYVTEFLKSSEGLEMNILFSRIKDVQLRRRVLELVRSIAEGAK